MTLDTTRSRGLAAGARLHAHEVTCRTRLHAWDWIDNYIGQHSGEPTVIFAHNLAAVDSIRDRLKSAGHRIAVITGTMSTDAKDKAKKAKDGGLYLVRCVEQALDAVRFADEDISPRQ